VLPHRLRLLTPDSFLLMQEDLTKQFTENRPADAMQFRQPGVDFSVKEQDGKHAVNLIAFSGGELYHWWWGRCIFDRSGATIAKEKIPVDYQHDPREVLGYLDTFGGTTALECSGFLVPFQKDDRASEILHKKKHGVPYQCSVSLDPANFEFEYIPRGQSVTVNGQTFSTEDEGLVIFRKYKIDGVAICLYGSDSNTSLFNRAGAQPHFTMPTEAPKTPAADTRELAKKFSAKFGNERGFQYFSDGLSEADATDRYLADLKKDFSAQDTLIAELQAKITAFEKKDEEDKDEKEEKKPVKSEEYAALKAEFEKLQEAFNRQNQAAGAFGGEATPAPASGNDKPKKEFSPLPPNLRAFADSIVLPNGR